MSPFLIASLVLLSFVPPGMAQCLSPNIDGSTHPDVRQSCKDLKYPLPKCIKLGHVYVFADDVWKGTGNDTVVLGTAPGTTTLKNSLGQFVDTPAFEYVYISDSRGIEEQKTVVGIVAARASDLPSYRSITVHRNAPSGHEHATYDVSATEYARGIERRSISDAMHDWINLPGYDASRDDLRVYSYVGPEAIDTEKKDGDGKDLFRFWRISMRLSQETGGISCIPFTIAHDDGITSLKIRAFLQSSPKMAKEFIFRFSN